MKTLKLFGILLLYAILFLGMLWGVMSINDCISEADHARL